MRWVLDSGASRHMTSDASILCNLRPTDMDITITFGNGGTGKATAVGDVQLCTPDATFWLTNVLLIPEATEHLISVRYATQRGLDFKFCADRCEIGREGQILAVAPSTGEAIYYLSGYSSSGSASAGYTALAARSMETPRLWHERYGHLGFDNLARLPSMVTGITTTADEFKAAASTGTNICEPCVLGKQHRNPFQHSASAATQPLALVHTDVCGPLPVTSLGGSRYFLTVLDDYSKYSFVQPLAHKSDVPAALQDAITLLENQTGYSVRCLRSDNGTEFTNAALSAYCRGKGIQMQTTVRYTPEQNGAAERLNRTLMEKVRPMLAASGLPKSTWAEAVTTASYLRNRSPVSGRHKTPHELFFGTKPDVSHLRVFGARAYALTPKALRTKLENTSEPGHFIGYPAGTKGYKILLDSGRIITSRDVTFVEQPTATTGTLADSHSTTAFDAVPITGEDETAGERGAEPVGAQPVLPAQPEQPAQPAPPPLQPAAPAGGAAPPAPLAPNAPQRPKRAATGVPASTWQQQSYMITGRQQHQADTALLATISEPATLAEALASEQADQWQLAANDEMASLQANNTWSVEPLPPGVTAIPLKWVFKTKLTPAGTVERHKARLVAKGFRQREGIDYDEVFAPVSKYTTLRSLLAMAAHQDLQIHQLDIKTAFLNGELAETVWVQQPPGYETGDSSMACRLHKSLYGLKQAPRAWHAKLQQHLEAHSFQPSAADPALFIKHGPDPIFLLVYVDDILIITQHTTAVEQTKAMIVAAFEARDLGAAACFLGMDIHRNRTARTISLGQSRLTAELLAKYGMADCNPLAVPLSSATKLTKTGEPLDTGTHTYSQLIGSLLYISVCTRPDISQAVGALARHMAAPTTAHWLAAKNVLRYIAGTSTFGITFGSSSSGSNSGFSLEAFCDADYAGDIDTRRSTTAYVFLLGQGAVSWSSRLQPTVAASTTEAEYMAAAYAIKEGLWLRTLLNDLGLKIPTVTINADNQGAIKLLKNPVFSVRSKHIDVIHHFARERVARNDISFKYISTIKMVADALTKPLPSAKFNFCRTEMGVGAITSNSNNNK